MPPERNQEVHRHQHHFPEQEEQEQVQRQEYAHNTTEDEQQVQVEKAHTVVNLVPGTEHGQCAEEASQRHQDQRQAVHRQMNLNTKTRDPGRSPFQQPMPGDLARQRKITGCPEHQADNQYKQHGGQRYPARCPVAPLVRLPAQQSTHKRDQDQPHKDHATPPGNTARASRMIVAPSTITRA